MDAAPDPPSLGAEHGRAQEEAGGSVAVATPPVHLAHQMDRRLGGRLVEKLDGARPSSGLEQVRVRLLPGHVVLPELGERADVALS